MKNSRNFTLNYRILIQIIDFIQLSFFIKINLDLILCEASEK